MINLASAKNEVLDPFCGAGGILEEVKLLGFNYVGVDISWKMINLARINMSRVMLCFVMDAFSWDNTC
jgi:tRNA (guanine10-N2)-dimethyltransferase